MEDTIDRLLNRARDHSARLARRRRFARRGWMMVGFLAGVAARSTVRYARSFL